MTKIIFITLYLIGWFVYAFKMMTVKESGFADTTEEIMSRYSSIDPGLLQWILYILALIVCLFWPYFLIKAFYISIKQSVQEVYGSKEKPMEVTDDMH